MRFIYLFIVLLIIASCSQKQKSNLMTAPKVKCSSFKLGTYKYVDTAKAGFVITRKEGVQIEHNKKTNDRFVGALTWLEECKYMLTYIEISDPKLSSLVGVSYTVDITDMSENSYSYKSYNKDQTSIGTLIKIDKKK